MARHWDLRVANVADAAQIARLSAQLGYPAPLDACAHRLRLIAASPRHVVWVAATADDTLLGMVGVEQRLMIEMGEPAEIVAMVVDPDARRLGIGAALIGAACDWARQCGCSRIFVRSNVLRDHAHAFYPALGFVHGKTQHVYEQVLGET